jgi:hypothetical protein
MGISFLITTICRPTLWNTLNSLVPIALPGDRIYLAVDAGWSDKVQAQVQNYADIARCPIDVMVEPEPLGYWGHALRNKYQKYLQGDYIHHMDDDDIYISNLKAVRELMWKFPGQPIISRFMVKPGFPAWSRPGAVSWSNVGTPSGFIPNEPDKFGYWRYVHGGDFSFYFETLLNFGFEKTIWIDEFTVRCRPHEYGYHYV